MWALAIAVVASWICGRCLRTSSKCLVQNTKQSMWSLVQVEVSLTIFGHARRWQSCRGLIHPLSHSHTARLKCAELQWSLSLVNFLSWMRKFEECSLIEYFLLMTKWLSKGSIIWHTSSRWCREDVFNFVTHDVEQFRIAPIFTTKHSIPLQ